MEDKRIDEIFEVIEDSNIDLDYDPIQRGPKFLNNMVARTRNMTNEIQKYEREVSKEQLRYERQLGKLEAEFEMKSNDLMSNDTTVKSLPSARDREAKVGELLQDLKDEINDATAALTDLGHVETIIKSKLRELKDINRDLRLQIRLVEDEISIGGDWGDQSDSSEPVKDENIDLDTMLPVDENPEVPDDYDELFGTSKDAEDSQDGAEGDKEAEDLEDDEVDYDAALDAIESEPSGGNTNVFSQEDDDDEIDVEDLLSGL